jgi:hypothetical protein
VPTLGVLGSADAIDSYSADCTRVNSARALVGALVLCVGVIALIGFSTVRQAPLTQPHLLLLDISAVLAIFSPLLQVGALQPSLIFLRHQTGDQTKALGETIRFATGI